MSPGTETPTTKPATPPAPAQPKPMKPEAPAPVPMQPPTPDTERCPGTGPCPFRKQQSPLEDLVAPLGVSLDY